MSEAACAQRVRLGDPDRYLATLAAPLAVRGDLFTLYALNLEAARAPWVTKEAMIAEMRLQWWRDILTEPTRRAHEVAGPAHAMIMRRGLPVALLDQMIAARIWDIYADPFEDAAAFDLYLDQTAGHLMWLAALICGAGADAEAPLRDFAHAAGLAGFLRAVPELVARGRSPLIDSSPTALRDLAQKGLDRLAIARKSRHLLRQAAPALLPGWQAGTVLAQVVANPLLVAQGGLELSEFSRRGRLAVMALTGRW